MKFNGPEPRPLELELELKLALPISTRAELAKLLARVPVLARCKPTELHLHNIYYDTAEQTLRKARVALRMRRLGSGGRPRWLQTLKIGGNGDSALSQRGEWETPTAGGALEPGALETTPWSDIDPSGTLFAALKPCFVTTFDRTVWRVRQRDGSEVEVAWDRGHVAAGARTAPICELELESRAGGPRALFDVARQIARTVAVIPLALSKSERGYAMEQDGLGVAVHAVPPILQGDLSVPQAAQCVLREMLCQFTSNLNALHASDDPEVVHQARVGWRRFTSARRLFKPVLAEIAQPAWQTLKPLLRILSDLRDLDVARAETLTTLAEAYVAGDAQRARSWRAFARNMDAAATLARTAVRHALEEPVIGATLLSATQWLEDLPSVAGPDAVARQRPQSLVRWARSRTNRLHTQLQTALRADSSAESQHQVRILAKRMRYAIEAMRSLLPRRSTRVQYRLAVQLQSGIGAARDLVQAAALASRLAADRGIVEFLRGLALGQQRADNRPMLRDLANGGEK